MATYKVLQDVEAEDKLIGPLTLRQFIYAGIAILCLWLTGVAISKHVPFLAIPFLPVAGVAGFFAFPWGRDQPTEIWALAKIRFLIKPRRRVWDQSGAKELVTITVPKKIERTLTNGLNQDEVRSRLNALASTIDSRGWAIKNANVNLSMGLPAAGATVASDRLVPASSLPQQVNDVDVRASDDILDPGTNPVAQHFDSMIQAASTAHRQQLLAQMQQPVAASPAAAAATVSTAAAQPAADYWFMHPAAAVPGQATFADTPMIAPGAQVVAGGLPQAAMPTADEEALALRLKAAHEHDDDPATYGHMKVLKTPEQLAEEQAAMVAAQAAAAKPAVTPATQAAILNLSENNDLDVATIARQAQKAQQDEGEVVISLR